jgi:signal transduction histidine kinase
VKHAQATRVGVSVVTADGELRIAVTDDGRGFDPGSPTGGFGLMGMRERIDLAGGRLAIAPNDPGTRVEVVLPAHARP